MPGKTARDRVLDTAFSYGWHSKKYGADQYDLTRNGKTILVSFGHNGGIYEATGTDFHLGPRDKEKVDTVLLALMKPLAPTAPSDLHPLVARIIALRGHISALERERNPRRIKDHTELIFRNKIYLEGLEEGAKLALPAEVLAQLDSAPGIVRVVAYDRVATED